MRAPARFAALALAAALGSASAAHATIYVDFILDGSGSMWGQVRGKARLALMREAVRSVHRHLPEGVEIGIRAFGIRGMTGQSVQLLPMGVHSEDAVRDAVREIVPKGQSELVVAMRDAAGDFAGKEGKRIVFFIGDGADTTVADACKPLQGIGERFGGAVHIAGLDVRGADEREQLRCIAQANGGVYKDARTVEGLIYAVRQVVNDLIEQERREEAERREAERRRRLLVEQTRLRIMFTNELDPFFADSVVVHTVLLDEQPLVIAPEAAEITGNEPVELIFLPVPEGKHTVSIRYVKRKGDAEGESELKRLQFEIERGKTTEVRVAARAGLARWRVEMTSEVKDTAPPPPESAQGS